MKIRYKSNAKGHYIEEAKIYDSEVDLSLSLKKVDPSALQILRRLGEEGFKSYLVGGAVRDLLLGLTPKDFDIATEAHPHQIKMLFGKRAILIGKRFRLVHVRTIGKEFIEVVTFRTTREKSLNNNSYGTIEEDVQRRDFSMNALFYDPLKGEVVDYVNGISSINRRVIEPVIPLRLIFKEDPVRMIRMIKYAVKTSFTIPFKLRWQIFWDKKCLKEVPTARLMDEILKILQSGNSRPTFHMLWNYGLLEIITPHLHVYLRNPVYKETFFTELGRLDSKASHNVDLTKEDYMKPIRQLGRIISRTKVIPLDRAVENLCQSYEEGSNLNSSVKKVKGAPLSYLLDELFAPIRFTGEWNLALKNFPSSHEKSQILKEAFSKKESTRLGEALDAKPKQRRNYRRRSYRENPS